MFCNLIKRTHILSLLKHNESAWDFELKGNVRSRKFDYYSIRKSCVIYNHGIVKGKWFLKIFNDLTSQGYEFKELNKKFTYFESCFLKIRTFLHDFYMYALPLKILLMIENKRKNNIYKS